MKYFTRQYAYGQTYVHTQAVKEERRAVPIPSDWDMFLFRVRKYRASDLKQFIEDKRYFDAALARVRRICGEEEHLIPSTVTRIKRPDTEGHPEEVVHTTVLKDLESMH